MAHKHPVYDTDKHFSIDPTTRKITNECGKLNLQQYDHDSERFTFEIPKLVDGHDMSLCNVVQIHFLNIEAANKSNKYAGIYEVDDLQTGTDDAADIVFGSWLISGNATQYVGSLNFVVRFACVADDGTIEYAWNTAIHSTITIGEGICNSDAVATEYADILEQWRQELFENGGGTVKTVNGETPDENGNVEVSIPEISITRFDDGGKTGVTISVDHKNADDNVISESATVYDGKDGQNGQDGQDGSPGKDGVDGVSVTHEWDGTVLKVTSASGTSSADLKGDPGKDGNDGQNGQDGSDGVGIASIKQTTTSTADGGDNVFTVTLTNGTSATFTVKNGSKGSTGADGKDGSDASVTETSIKNALGYIPANPNTLSLGVHTDGLVYLFVDGTPVGTGVEMAVVGGDVVGYVDENNNIVVSGNLADGTYSVKYEMVDGSTIDIGNLVLDTNVYYTVTNTLTNCTNSNTANQATGGEPYSATISAISGYELSSVVVTMGGNAVTVTDGVIDIAEVTGNIVITAVAEEKTVEPSYTNLFDPSKATINKRTNSNFAVVDANGYVITGWIDVKNKVPFTDSTKIYIKGAGFTNGGDTHIRTYSSTGTSYDSCFSNVSGSNASITDEGNGVISVTKLNATFASNVVRAYFCLKVKDSALTTADIQNIVITIDEPIA